MSQLWFLALSVTCLKFCLELFKNSKDQVLLFVFYVISSMLLHFTE